MNFTIYPVPANKKGSLKNSGSLYYQGDSPDITAFYPLTRTLQFSSFLQLGP
jgi:hypothetical protein